MLTITVFTHRSGHCKVSLAIAKDHAQADMLNTLFGNLDCILPFWLLYCFLDISFYRGFKLATPQFDGILSGVALEERMPAILTMKFHRCTFHFPSLRLPP